MSTDGIPVVFVAPRSLRVLNVIAVASSIAACTAAAFMGMMPGTWSWALIAGVPTFAVGAGWALLLRWQKTAPRSGVPLGWLASVPLAALNAALACGVLLTSTCSAREAPAAFIGGAFIGVTFGAFFWIPALLLVLVVFGVPIARAHRLARRGLAGEERGERLIGIVAAALGAAALLYVDAARYSPDYGHLGYTHLAPPVGLTWLGVLLLHAFCGGAIGCGTVAAFQAAAREARRRRFVQRVEALEEPAFRVEPTALGKVLLRVAPVASYRVSDYGEEVFELDEAGRATRRLA